MERQIRRSVEELMIADDRILADIGLTRQDVDHAVRYGRLSADRRTATDRTESRRHVESTVLETLVETPSHYT